MAAEIGKTGCPYFYCSATVTTVTSTNPTTGETRTILMEHDIQHPILSGSCIASLMPVPIPFEVQQHFDKRQATDAIIVNKRYGITNNAIPNLGQGPIPASSPKGVSVSSVGELIGQINVAAEIAGEAVSELQNIQNGLDIVLSCIGQVRDKVDAMGADVQSDLLMGYSRSMTTAHEQTAALSAQIQEIKSLISQGQDAGHEFIGRLLG